MTITAMTSVLLGITVSALSIDCPKMINLAIGLHINSKQPSIMTQLQSDCCVATGITCSSQRVTQISWSSLSLDGILNETAIPSSLTFLNLQYNTVTGPLPSNWPVGLNTLYYDYNKPSNAIPTTFPASMQILGLGGCQTGGSIPILPSGITTLYLFANQLTGSIPAMPSSLTYLDLGNNLLTGSIPLLPTGITFLHIDTNSLTGSLPYNLPAGLTDFKVHGNLMTGDIPNNLPLTIKTLWLGHSGNARNHFTGTLPLGSPTSLFINDNWITDIIIFNPAQLTTCDLSNNPLLGNSNIALLSVCTKLFLYSPSLLPNTMTTTILAKKMSTTSSTSIQFTFKIFSSSSITQKAPLPLMFNPPKSRFSAQPTFYTSTSILDTSTMGSNEMPGPVNLQSTSLITLPYSASNLVLFAKDILKTKRITTVPQFNRAAMATPISFLQLLNIGIKVLIEAIVLTAVLVKIPYKRLRWNKMLRTKRKSSLTNFDNGLS